MTEYEKLFRKQKKIGTNKLFFEGRMKQEEVHLIMRGRKYHVVHKQANT